VHRPSSRTMTTRWTLEAEVQVGTRATRKRMCDQLRWNYRDVTGGDGGSEGGSDDDVVLSADERKHTMIGYGGIARRRSFRDD